MGQPIRIPLAEPLTNRDSSAAKDSQLSNCTVESVGGYPAIIKRPGVLQSVLGVSGQAQGMACMSSKVTSFSAGSVYDTTQAIVTGWTAETVTINPTIWYGIAAGTPGVVAAGGPTGAVFSADGISWQTISPTITSYGAVYGNGIYIIGGGGTTTYYTSTNGTSWTTRTATSALGAILYLPGVGFVSAWGTSIGISTDGTTWTFPSTNFSGANIGFAIDGNRLLAARNTAPISTQVSSDGIHWTNGQMPTAFTGASITGGGGRFVALTYNTTPAQAAISTDGINWTVTNTSISAWSSPGVQLAMSYVNGYYFAMVSSASTAYIMSSDGVNWAQGALPTAIGSIAGSTSMVYFNNAIVVPAHAGTTFYRSQGITFRTTTLPIGATDQTSIIYPCTGVAIVKTANTLFTYSGGTVTQVPKSILSVTVTNPGSGGTAGTYALGITGGNGTGATGTYTIAGGSVISVTITAGGTGYTSSPTISFPSGGVTGATGAAVLNGYPVTTVPGIAFLDSTYYVMDGSGKIYGSNLNDPLTWSSLNFIVAGAETDCGVAITRNLNYIIAFKERSTEFFYDAGNPTGSPLSSVPNAYFKVGCASGTSVVTMENMVVWMSRSTTKGRQIMALEGFQPQVISTPEVDRILNADNLSTVYAFPLKINGSNFYVITLTNSNKTLAFDFETKVWAFWTSMTPQTAKSVTSITSVNGVATVSQTAHGYADGDVVTIAGASPAAYNGTVNITFIDANTYSYPVPLGTASPATGTITATGFTEAYFNKVGYMTCNGIDYLQGETDGIVYQVDPSYGSDNNNYINMRIRTIRIDGGNTKRKFIRRAELVGDKVAATAFLRYSDDDYQTYTPYTPMSMAAKRTIAMRLGHTRRRAFELRITDNQPIRVEALELDVESGIS